MRFALVLLMRDKGDERYDRAVVRWLGQWLTDNSEVGLEFAAELAGTLEALQGASPDVARAQVAVLLRHAGSESAGRGPQRW